MNEHLVSNTSISASLAGRVRAAFRRSDVLVRGVSICPWMDRAALRRSGVPGSRTPTVGAFRRLLLVGLTCPSFINKGRLDLDYFESQSESPRLNQRLLNLLVLKKSTPTLATQIPRIDHLLQQYAGAIF